MSFACLKKKKKKQKRKENCRGTDGSACVSVMNGLSWEPYMRLLVEKPGWKRQMFWLLFSSHLQQCTALFPVPAICLNVLSAPNKISPQGIANKAMITQSNRMTWKLSRHCAGLAIKLCSALHWWAFSDSHLWGGITRTSPHCVMWCRHRRGNPLDWPPSRREWKTLHVQINRAAMMLDAAGLHHFRPWYFSWERH